MGQGLIKAVERCNLDFCKERRKIISFETEGDVKEILCLRGRQIDHVN